MNIWSSALRWPSAQLGQQSCELYAPAALYPKGNSLVLISIKGWMDPSEHSGYVSGNFPGLYRESKTEPPVWWRSASTKRGTALPGNYIVVTYTE